MQKRILSLVTSLFLVISLVGVLPAVTASALTYEDYEYSVLDDGTVEITGYTGSATTLSIPSIINGKKVTSFGECAFIYCESLTSITIPNSVKYIGDYAFYVCPSLTNITIGNGVTSIGEGAFEHCYSLTNITIPSNVTSIGEWAFCGCESLTSITIPNSVTSIGGFAFDISKVLQVLKFQIVL